ncbi:MAG: T9SS type B sorting domain-containing protein, partial [Bacteroidota bacterium]
PIKKKLFGLSCLIAPLFFILQQTETSTAPLLAVMVEDCANALDDDGDGLVDLNDPDCTCSLIEPVSLIPNPSFEELNCCPSTRSQLNCAESWVQASEPTTDLIHNCGWEGWPDFPPPLPFPDGDGVMGFRDGRMGTGEPGDEGPRPNWKEYAGACLLEPLQAGQTYRIEFDLGFVDRQKSPPIWVTFFGTVDCTNLPFGIGDEELGCPTNGRNWIRLGERLVSGGPGSWVNTFIEVTPNVDIAAIAIGPPCARSSAPVSTFYFFDNLILDNLTNFTFRVRPTTHPCAEDLAFEVPELSGLTYQWYLDGIALVGETSFRLSRSFGEGEYQVVIDDGMSCQVSDAYRYRVPVIFSTPSVTICAGETYPFGELELNSSGSYQDTFRSVAGCDSIAQLELLVLDELSEEVSARIFPGESYSVGSRRLERPGEYPIRLSSKLGCDSLILLDLSYYQVYFPSAFSPNGDGINDRFGVQGGEDLLEVSRLEVFDRWGNLLSDEPEWDGYRAGEPLDPGIYVFIAYLIMSDGLERRMAGEVLLLK